MAARDEQCPERSFGLTHRAEEGTTKCLFCGENLAPYDPKAHQDALRDRPQPGFCREGNHLHPLCYRIGYGPDLAFICFHHLTRLVRDHHG